MKLKLGPIILAIEGLTVEDIPMNTRLFLTDEACSANLVYHFHEVDTLPLPGEGWEEIFQRPDIRVWQNGTLEARRLAVGNPDAVYAHYQEINDKEIEVSFLKTIKQELTIDTIFISCLAMERHLHPYGGYILHCCFLHYHGQAILFSGPSGIGKSTHANLWCQYIEDTHVVNGDRCLIYRNEAGEYQAHAWPVCGSSNICLTESYPLRAIVFMEQAPHNEVVKVRPMQLFKQLSSQITINWWNKEEVNRTLDALQQMLVQVPMCNYACNLTEEAPQKLNNYLKEKQWIS